VGALTIENFRFRQRVWYLKEANSICPAAPRMQCQSQLNEEACGDSPRENKEVNATVGCATSGATLYKICKSQGRLLRATRQAAIVEESPSRMRPPAGLKLRETPQKFGRTGIA